MRERNAPETQEVSDSIAVAANSPNTDSTKEVTEFKVAEKREDGTVMLMAEDGRMFPATVADGVEGIRKGSTVIITAQEYADGIPQAAEIVRVS